MNIEIETKLSGRIAWLEVRRKDGSLKQRLEDIKNIINIQSTWTDAKMGSPSNTHRTFTSTTESWDDVNGTWSQSGNTITRSTGTGTFPSSPSQLGNELYWMSAGADTGHRCHITARGSDTSITVSGLPKTITGGTLRRYVVNGEGVSHPSTGAVQSSTSATEQSNVYDDVAGTRVVSYLVIFPSATSSYTVGSLIPQSFSRIVLPSPVALDIDDQLTYLYEATETVSGRLQTYDLGAESVGIPQKHSMTSIVGSGSNVDVTFSGATPFLAGDKLDLRNVICKKFAISSISSDASTFYFTVTGHGRSIADTIVVENATNAAYNGTWVISDVPDANTIEVADVSNPGASAAGGTIRLQTPATYFDDLGLATIASMVSSSVARITSSITGPDVEPAQIGGDPGVTVVFQRKSSTSTWTLASMVASKCYAYTEANAKAIADHESNGTITTTGQSWTFTTVTPTSAAYGNDWTNSILLEKGAGAGTDITRCKQLMFTGNGASDPQLQITFNTPFNKTTAERLRVTIRKQLLRDLYTA